MSFWKCPTRTIISSTKAVASSDENSVSCSKRGGYSTSGKRVTSGATKFPQMLLTATSRGETKRSHNAIRSKVITFLLVLTVTNDGWLYPQHNRSGGNGYNSTRGNNSSSIIYGNAFFLEGRVRVSISSTPNKKPFPTPDISIRNYHWKYCYFNYFNNTISWTVLLIK